MRTADLSFLSVLKFHEIHSHTSHILTAACRWKFFNEIYSERYQNFRLLMCYGLGTEKCSNFGLLNYLLFFLEIVVKSSTLVFVCKMNCDALKCKVAKWTKMAVFAHTHEFCFYFKR